MTSLTKISNDEMKETATRICRDYLNGTWKSINSEDIKFKRISGGLSNFLFYVSLPDIYDSNPGSPNSNGDHQQQQKPLLRPTKRIRKDSGQSFGTTEPKEVLLRIYGQTHGEHALETMLTESVVFTLLSERNLGPKLHGIFPGGRIEQYIPARPLLTSELSEYKISMKIAEKMAEIHSLNIPVSKEPDWLWKSMERWLITANNILKEKTSKENNNESLKNEIKKIDIEYEVNWLKSIIINSDYPVVFCHNDLQEGNILFKQDSSNSLQDCRIIDDTISRDATSFNEEASHAYSEIHSSREMNQETEFLSTTLPVSGNKIDTPEKCRKRSLATDCSDLDNSTRDSVLSTSSDDSCDPDLLIIDYEYCAYNYRGFDIANHFLEWTLDYKNEQFPYYYHKKTQYPTMQQRHNFIAAYLRTINQISNESVISNGEDIEEIDYEVAVFTMVSHLFWSLWSIVNVSQNIEFGYWDYAVTRLREYLSAKKDFCSSNKVIVTEGAK